MAVISKKAEYAGTCAKCGTKIAPGDWIYWSTVDHKASHAACPVPDEAHTIYGTEPLLP